MGSGLSAFYCPSVPGIGLSPLYCSRDRLVSILLSQGQACLHFSVPGTGVSPLYCPRDRLVSIFRAASLPAVAGIRPGEKVEKHFPAWQNSQTVCSGSEKFLSGVGLARYSLPRLQHSVRQKVRFAPIRYKLKTVMLMTNFN